MKQYKILLGLDEEDLQQIKKTGTFIIPEDVNEIAPYVFAGIKELVSIIIPSSVSVIGTRAFAECSNLSKVTFRSSNKVMMGEGIESPFADCDSLTFIILDRIIKDKELYEEVKSCLGAMSPEEYKEFMDKLNKDAEKSRKKENEERVIE